MPHESVDVMRVKKAQEILSDVSSTVPSKTYKHLGDLGVIDMNKQKMNCIFSTLAFFILQRGYRLKLDQQPFTTPHDRVDMACAKNAAEVLNEVSGTSLKYACCELQDNAFANYNGKMKLQILHAKILYGKSLAFCYS